MKAPADHQAFLSRRDYPLGITGVGVFPDEELSILRRFGFWLEALADGRIAPITPAEERFVRVVRGEIIAETVFERAWTRLIGRREIEPELAREHEVVDPSEAWFRRDAHWRYH